LRARGRRDGWRESEKHGEVGEGKIESDNNSNTTEATSPTMKEKGTVATKPVEKTPRTLAAATEQLLTLFMLYVEMLNMEQCRKK